MTDRSVKQGEVMSPKIVDKEEKRLLIAHAAFSVFGDKGFDRTRMDDVATAAGVGKGTLYEYFNNKEDLLVGAMGVMMDGMADGMRGALENNSPPLDKLRGLTVFMVEAMEHMGEGYRFFLEYMLHVSRARNDFPILREMLLEFRKGIEDLLVAGVKAGDLRKDLDIVNTAATFAAWFDGAIFHWIAVPQGPSMSEMADVYMDTFFTGILDLKGGRR